MNDDLEYKGVESMGFFADQNRRGLAKNFDAGKRNLETEIALKKKEGFIIGARIRITDGKYKGDYVLEGLDEGTGILNLYDKKNRRRVTTYTVGSPVVELI